MSLIVFNRDGFPSEVLMQIIGRLDGKTWKAFVCTCKNNSHLGNWPEKRVIDFLSDQVRKIGLQDEMFEKLHSIGKFPLFTRCRIPSQQFSEFLQKILNPNFESAELHLQISGPEDVKVCKKIVDKKYIEIISFLKGRNQIGNVQAIEILSNLQKVKTVHIGQTEWIKDVDLVKMRNGQYYPSFTNVQQVDIQSDIDARSLLKVLRLFPNLKSLSVPGLFPASKIHIQGKENLTLLETALSTNEGFDGFNTKCLLNDLLGCAKMGFGNL
jgi:hypothetical protein